MDYLDALIRAKQEGVTEAEFKELWQEEKKREREERIAHREEAERQREREEAEKQREEAEREREEAERIRRFEIEKLTLQQGKVTPFNHDHDTSVVREETIRGPRIPTFKEGDDLDSYLKRFEILAKANQWSVETWAARLGALLTGRSLEIYSTMDEDQSQDYEAVKGVLFKKYLLTAEGYRKKFRNSRPEKDETYTQLAVRLQRYLDRWIDLSNEEKSVEGISNLFIREQILKIVDSNLSIFLRERNPETIDELVKMADLYSEAHQKGAGKLSEGQKVVTTGKRNCFNCGSQNHLSKDCKVGHRSNTNGIGANSRDRNRYEGGSGNRNHEGGSRGCYICGAPNHVARFCNRRLDRAAVAFVGSRNRAENQSWTMRSHQPGHPSCGVTGCGTLDRAAMEFVGPERVEDQTRSHQRSHEVRGLDKAVSGFVGPETTGAENQTMTTERSRQPSYPGVTVFSTSENVNMSGFPDEGNVATGEVTFQKEEGNVEDDISASTTLVDDLADDYLEHGLVEGKTVTVLRDTGCTGVIMKRSVVPLTAYTGEQRTCLLMDGTRRLFDVARLPIDTPFFKGEVTAMVVDNPVAEVIVGNIKGASIEKAAAMRTRAQRKLEEEHTDESDVNLDSTSNESNQEDVPSISKLSPNEIAQLQKEDQTLRNCWERVNMNDDEDNESWFKVKNGVLHRFKKRGAGRQDKKKQVVVPKKHREEIMRIAHENVFAGHLGSGRTLDRITESFFWPGIGADVQRFCRSCDACQKTSPKGKIAKAPLIPSPIMDTPFDRVAVDIIGPLPRTEKGNSYILTLVDYATRFPEAKALPKITAEAVSEALMEMFSRLGIPNEVVSDRGTQFTGDLMREVSSLLNTKQLFTTPYHAMANGLCERFNGVLKSMLRRVAHKHPKRWDTFLSPLLFSYRETPQASTGFSPFELMFGHSVKGPLTLLKDIWTGEANPEVRTTYEYVLDMRERLQETMELANENVREAQRRQKKYFDRGTRQRKLKPGDSVLILLPTETNKLEMTWRGPFKVEERRGQVDYIVNVKGKRKMYHINMLKGYEHRIQEEVSASAVVTDGDEGEDDIPVRLGETTPQINETETFRDVKVGDELSLDERRKMEDLLEEFRDVFSDVPGQTHMLEHKIQVLDSKPIKVKPYNLPQATREAVKTEVENMLEAGVIERSDSPYSSPIVLVKKTDDDGNVKYRFCNDYRKLNAVTQDDAEPMPEIETIMGRLADSKYFSKIDLTKGFWQVPMHDESKAMTAFSTPYGHYQYRVLPFGLRNSPATFNRLMRRVLDGVRPGIEVFVDDVLIHSRTWDEHISLCRELLYRLRNAGLKARPTKCFMGLGEVDYLGHVIGDGSVKPQDRKIEAITKCERPTTKKQVRSFLGLTGYYRKFVPNYAAISAPLSDMTKKSRGEKFRWEQAQENAFECLKSRLTTAPILKMPKWNEEFILQTDASNYGISACLLQLHGDVRHPVIYVSRKLRDAEKKYSTIERECLAIVFALSKLEHYLYGRHFIIETDHAPLTWLKKNQQQNARVTRWALAMQPFDFRVENIKGRDALWADALSRLPAS